MQTIQTGTLKWYNLSTYVWNIIFEKRWSFSYFLKFKSLYFSKDTIWWNFSYFLIQILIFFKMHDTYAEISLCTVYTKE